MYSCIEYSRCQWESQWLSWSMAILYFGKNCFNLKIVIEKISFANCIFSKYFVVVDKTVSTNTIIFMLLYTWKRKIRHWIALKAGKIFASMRTLILLIRSLYFIFRFQWHVSSYSNNQTKLHLQDSSGKKNIFCLEWCYLIIKMYMHLFKVINIFKKLIRLLY